MAARKTKEEEINLLPQKGFQTSTAGRVLVWILSTFRVIVIVTEIIVMIAFLSRFWFDAQNSDLNEQIQEKQAVLLAYQDFEKNFKDVQKRLDIYTSFTKSPMEADNLLNTIRDYLPPDVIAKGISVENNIVEVKGVTTNEKSIEQFIVNLNFDSTFKDASLSAISTEKDNPSAITFTVNARINKEI